MKYGFFPGCSYGSAAGYRESVDAISRVLGIRLMEIPDWNCCGATSFFSIDEFKAIALAGRVFALSKASGFTEIVTTCNACYTTLRKAWSILARYPDQLDSINNSLIHEGLKIEGSITVRHILDVLVNDVPKEIWLHNRVYDNTDLKVAGYYGCQLTRPWGDLDHPERPDILECFIERLGFVPVDHSAKTICCGASHAVPYAKDCRSLILRILNEVRIKGAQIVTTVCPMCQFNLDAGQQTSGQSPIPITFFTQLSGFALGLDPGALGFKKLLIPAEDVLKRIS
mmetsp:Transcript_22084/g.10473  ORF Transcript_22084/g.10473 Transcript_22084/m.10473 type:complete len:284 (-) Transcript_22084:62-913(-)